MAKCEMAHEHVKELRAEVPDLKNSSLGIEGFGLIAMLHDHNDL